MTLCQQQSLTTTGWCIQCNMLIYLVSTYILALSDLKGKIGNANVDLLSFLVLCSSALVFAYDTCNSYRTNGWWIILNFCLIGGFMFFFLEISGICSPGLYWNIKAAVIYAGLLTMRLSFDVARRVFKIPID